MTEESSGPVAYLTKRFPRLSETFILDEILGLEAAGVPLQLYSIANPREAIVQPKVSQVKSSVRYLHPEPAVGGSPRALFKDVAEVAVATGRILVRHPLAWLSTVAYIAKKRRHLSTVKHFFEATKMAVAVEDEASTHVHAAFAHGPASVAHFVSRLTGIPFSFSAHAKDLYLSPPNLLARKASAASFVTVCSASAAAELRRVIASHDDPAVASQTDKVILAPHGVDVERFHPVPRAMADNRTKARILAVGRLVPKKGYPVLLDALESLCRDGLDFECRIVGTGDLRQEMVSRISSGPLASRVTLLGALAQPEVLAQYHWADIFVQASVVVSGGDRDGIPNSLVEAMATGLAVVGSDVAGIPEVITDGRTGIVVPSADAASLADALGSLVGDPARRQELGGKARRWVEQHFSRQDCIAYMATLFGYGAANETTAAGQASSLISQDFEDVEDPGSDMAVEGV